MNSHKHARLTPRGRALLMTRMLEESRTLRSCVCRARVRGAGRRHARRARGAKRSPERLLLWTRLEELGVIATEGGTRLTAQMQPGKRRPACQLQTRQTI